MALDKYQRRCPRVNPIRGTPYQHRMTRISQQSYASRVVSPFTQRLPVHQAPFEGRLDESKQLTYSIRKYWVTLSENWRSRLTVVQNHQTLPSSCPHFPPQSRTLPIHRLDALERDYTVPSPSRKKRVHVVSILRRKPREENRRTIGYDTICLLGPIQLHICGCSINSRNSGSCIMSEAGIIAR